MACFILQMTTTRDLVLAQVYSRIAKQQLGARTTTPQILLSNQVHEFRASPGGVMQDTSGWALDVMLRTGVRADVSFIPNAGAGGSPVSETLAPPMSAPGTCPAGGPLADAAASPTPASCWPFGRLCWLLLGPTVDVLQWLPDVLPPSPLRYRWP
jgi:hypothetical protein